jgi:hypothetical protein
MGGERTTFPELMLFVAVSEQAIVALDELEPPANRDLLASMSRARDLAMAELELRRHLQGGTGPPTRADGPRPM